MIKFALHQYLPKRYLKRAAFEDIDRHRMILDFKDGKPYATRWAAREICNSLSSMDLSDTIIVCVPACCKRTNDRRFKEFSSIICERTGAVNGFSHVQVFGHRRKAHIDHVHELADNADEYIHVDGDFFRGRKVIVLDDIVTTCKTANAFIDRMASAGADVRMVLFLAKTKQLFACAQQHVKRKSN